MSKITGEDFNALTDSLGRAGKNLHEALIDPGEITAKVLASVMGGVQNLKALGLEPMDQALQTVLSRIFALNNVGERNLALNALVGRGWMTNLETLQMLAEKGYGPAIEQAKKFGMYFDDNAARQAKQYTEAMNQLKAGFSGIGTMIGRALIPYIIEIMADFHSLGKYARALGDGFKYLGDIATGQFGKAEGALYQFKQRMADAKADQTAYLANLNQMADESGAAAKAQLDLETGHQKAAHAAHEHAKAAKKLRDTWKEMIPEIDTIASLMAQMDASKAESSMRSAAKFRLSVQQGTYQPNLTDLGGVPTGANTQGFGMFSSTVDAANVIPTKLGMLKLQFADFFTDVAADGQGFTDKVFGSMERAMDGLSDQLARLVVTGRASFRQLGMELEGNILKAGFQHGIGQIAGKIAPHLAVGAGGGKRGDSPGSPMFVKEVGSPGLGVPGFGKGGAGSGGGSGPDSEDGVQSKLTGAFHPVFSDVGKMMGELTSHMSSLLGGLGKMFGGFLATGGNVTPGKAYVVGEKHSEFFVPHQAGQVAPALHMAGQTQQNIVNLHIHGVQDADTFRRSHSQIGAMLLNQMAIAQARNGGS